MCFIYTILRADFNIYCSKVFLAPTITLRLCKDPKINRGAKSELSTRVSTSGLTLKESGDPL